MGGGKGGSDFNPKGKSDGEIRRFCESFMTELYRYLHPYRDVPAGDIGVGGREIGYMYGQYKRLTNKHGEGILTGKSLLFGGSPLRPEATGFGLIYMTQIAVKEKLGRSLEGMRCAVSGSGNVAQFAAQKLLELKAKVITLSDSNGVLVFENGMTKNDWNMVVQCKNVHRARLSSLADMGCTGTYIANQTPWSIDVLYDLALPCATQDEINEKGAARLVKNGVLGCLEGANMPTNMKAQDVFRRNQILYVPGKAANAGGVGVSGLEMSQNAQHLTWKPEEVDSKLQSMMQNIYQQISEFEETGASLEEGANRAGFLKVAHALRELGWAY
jgi:glutamate dehydrogenase (NADP+)